MLLTPLMGGEMTQVERVAKGLKILQREEKQLNKEELIRMEAVLYAMAMKFLNVEELKRIKEVMNMSILAKMLMEDGIQKGIQQGITIYQTLQETGSVQESARRLNEPEDQVREIAVKYKVTVSD